MKKIPEVENLVTLSFNTEPTKFFCNFVLIFCVHFLVIQELTKPFEKLLKCIPKMKTRNAGTQECHVQYSLKNIRKIRPSFKTF
jgi:hypothetical protein